MNTEHDEGWGTDLNAGVQLHRRAGTRTAYAVAVRWDRRPNW